MTFQLHATCLKFLSNAEGHWMLLRVHDGEDPCNVIKVPRESGVEVGTEIVFEGKVLEGEVIEA